MAEGEKAKEQGPEEVSDALFSAANSGPAILTNRFVVSVSPIGVRVAFMEQGKTAETAVFRTAVVMSHQDGILFYKLLRDLLADFETAIDVATEEVRSRHG